MHQALAVLKRDTYTHAPQCMYVHTYIHTYICTQQATALWAVLLCNVCALLSKAIVFVVGGGNYIEYLNLQDYAKVQSHAVKAHWTMRK